MPDADLDHDLQPEVGQPDRPLSARLDEEDAVAGVEAIVAAVRGLARPGGLSVEARFALAAQLDDDAHSSMDGAFANLTALHAPGGAHWSSFAAAMRDAHGALLEVYWDCMREMDQAGVEIWDPSMLRECRVRLMRAGAERVRWQALARGPDHPTLWPIIGSTLLRALDDKDNPADFAVALPGRRESWVEREYLCAIAFNAAGLGQLAPELASAVDRLVRLLCPVLLLKPEPLKSPLYFVSPGAEHGPRRMMKQPEDLAGVWFFSARDAIWAMREMAEQIRAGTRPSGLADWPEDLPRLLAALAHLRRHWSDNPPARRFRRHLLQGSLSVVTGLAELKAVLGGGVPPVAATWVLRDVSRGGVGALASVEAVRSMRLGELVALKSSDGSAWHLGIVRRVHREDEELSLVGIETLSQHPVVATVDDGQAPLEVFICDPLLRGEAVRIAAPLGVLRPGASLFIAGNGSVQKLKPLEYAVRGVGFELRVYQVL